MDTVTASSNSHIIVNETTYSNDTKNNVKSKENPSFGSNVDEDYSK